MPVVVQMPLNQSRFHLVCLLGCVQGRVK